MRSVVGGWGIEWSNINIPIEEHLLAPSRVTTALVMKVKGRRKTSKSIVQNKHR
jgi:hypothetical protein